MVRVILNKMMQADRSQYVQAKAYERTKDRKGHANGYREACLWQNPKRLGPCLLGDITFAIPQVREGGFNPSALEKGIKSERVLLQR